jgi:hypothetical protein
LVIQRGNFTVARIGQHHSQMLVGKIAEKQVGPVTLTGKAQVVRFLTVLNPLTPSVG